MDTNTEGKFLIKLKNFKIKKRPNPSINLAVKRKIRDLGGLRPVDLNVVVHPPSYQKYPDLGHGEGDEAYASRPLDFDNLKTQNLNPEAVKYTLDEDVYDEMLRNVLEHVKSVTGYQQFVEKLNNRRRQPRPKSVKGYGKLLEDDQLIVAEGEKITIAIGFERSLTFSPVTTVFPKLSNDECELILNDVQPINFNHPYNIAYMKLNKKYLGCSPHIKFAAEFAEHEESRNNDKMATEDVSKNAGLEKNKYAPSQSMNPELEESDDDFAAEFPVHKESLKNEKKMTEDVSKEIDVDASKEKMKGKSNHVIKKRKKSKDNYVVKELSLSSADESEYSDSHSSLSAASEISETSGTSEIVKAGPKSKKRKSAAAAESKSKKLMTGSKTKNKAKKPVVGPKSKKDLVAPKPKKVSQSAGMAKVKKIMLAAHAPSFQNTLSLPKIPKVSAGAAAQKDKNTTAAKKNIANVSPPNPINLNKVVEKIRDLAPQNTGKRQVVVLHDAPDPYAVKKQKAIIAKAVQKELKQKQEKPATSTFISCPDLLSPGEDDDNVVATNVLPEIFAPSPASDAKADAEAFEAPNLSDNSVVSSVNDLDFIEDTPHGSGQQLTSPEISPSPPYDSMKINGDDKHAETVTNDEATPVKNKFAPLQSIDPELEGSDDDDFEINAEGSADDLFPMDDLFTNHVGVRIRKF